MAGQFPRYTLCNHVHSPLSRKVVDGMGMVFHWTVYTLARGSDPEEFVFMGECIVEKSIV